MGKKKIMIPKKQCFLCYNFTLGEFTEEDIKLCAENWLDAENCPNWSQVKVFIRKRKKFREIVIKE